MEQMLIEIERLDELIALEEVKKMNLNKVTSVTKEVKIIPPPSKETLLSHLSMTEARIDRAQQLLDKMTA